MAEAPRLAIRAIELYERPVRLRLPFRFGVVTLTECPQAFARVRVELADGRSGRSAWGGAAELMAPKWFDKNLALSNDDNFEQLRDVLRLARDAYLADAAPDTAFGHFARHHDAQLAAGAARGYNPLLASYGAALVDRAVLDALCRALGVSFYAAVRANLPGLGARHAAFAPFDWPALLPTLRPAAAIEARHTVGLVDAITAAELQQPVGDGLPETLEQVVAHYGHRYFKLKVGGQVEADIARLAAIAAVLDRRREEYFVSLDGNEQYADAAGVAELLARLRGTPALARLYRSILFVEQPIARKAALDVDVHSLADHKPVIVDESDGTLDAFVQARSRGYAGISSKTCKGLYKSLLNAARCAAWNAEEGTTRYFLSGEDLTTQAGLAVQQDLALVNLLGIGHVERNGHHYVDGMAALPAAEQQAFLDAHPDLYERSHGVVRLRIRDGRIALASLDVPGYASGAMPDWSAMAPLAGRDAAPNLAANPAPGPAPDLAPDIAPDAAPRGGAASRVRVPALARLGTYRVDRSYEWNYAHGPVWSGPLPEVPETPTKAFFGLPVASRLGISAGLLLNSAWIDFYARCGFDILTYKTVRSRRRACQPKPNWLFVDEADARRLERSKRSDPVHARARPAVGGPQTWTSTVSFGMPSREPAVWMADVAAARGLIGPRQALIVSVVASPGPGSTADETVRDFGNLAAMAREAGAQLVEANLSCPNVTSAEGDLFQDAELSGRIARALRAGAGALPVLLKIGHLEDDRELRALLRAVDGAASGLVIVNGVSRPVLDAAGAPAYGAGRHQAGILGRGVHPIGVHDVARAVARIHSDRLDLEVAGVGGVATADDVERYFAAGACAVLMGSAPMFDPALAARLKAADPQW